MISLPLLTLPAVPVFVLLVAGLHVWALYGLLTTNSKGSVPALDTDPLTHSNNQGKEKTFRS